MMMMMMTMREERMAGPATRGAQAAMGWEMEWWRWKRMADAEMMMMRRTGTGVSLVRGT